MLSIKDQKFGIEIEMTGLTRNKAAKIIGNCFQTTSEYVGGFYDKYRVIDNTGRKWNVVYDSSISTYNGRGRRAGGEYAVELVSPICKYDDIEDIQKIIRLLKKEGNAQTNNSCGIHIHIDASRFDANKLRNLTNIMYCKEDMIYRALQVSVARENRYCSKVQESFLQELNKNKPQTMHELSNIWYEGHSSRSQQHYDRSRYHALNLHSVFSKGTIEFRLFNGTLHAGEIKSYIQLCLAITNQALTQTRASRIKTQSTNEKYTFRTWLLRLGLIGDEFKTARHHLLKHLDGIIAWHDPEQAERQRQRLAAQSQEEQTIEEIEPINEDTMTMSM